MRTQCIPLRLSPKKRPKPKNGCGTVFLGGKTPSNRRRKRATHFGSEPTRDACLRRPSVLLRLHRASCLPWPGRGAAPRRRRRGPSSGPVEGAARGRRDRARRPPWRGGRESSPAAMERREGEREGGRRRRESGGRLGAARSLGRRGERPSAAVLASGRARAAGPAVVASPRGGAGRRGERPRARRSRPWRAQVPYV